METYEITWIDTADTENLTEAEAINRFGKDEWEEIKQGYLPNIVAVAL